MSGYRVEWDCCGDETYTQAWIPEECPFCKVNSLQSEAEKLAQALRDMLDDAADNGYESICTEKARTFLYELESE